VKGVAARSEFVDAIVNKGKWLFSKENKDFPEKVNNYGIEFDSKFVLLIMQPIRFANLKASDINSVSSH
jgi:hypothetical protein